MSTSRGAEIIAGKLQGLDPASPRHHALSAALQFKSSWVQLGEELTTVRGQQLYRDWGFKSFNDYCKDEIRITSETAAKLCRSFIYLSENKPQMVQEPPQGEVPPRVPDYRAVDLLARMKDNERVPEPVYQDLSQAAFEQDMALSELRKRFKEEAPEAFSTRSQARPADPRRRLRNALSQSAKLIETLNAVDGIDEHLLEEAEQLHSRVAEMLQALESPPA